MQPDQLVQPDWSDVLFVPDPEPTISYRTAFTVYEESLTKGRFVGRGWNGSGFINFYDGRLDPAQHPTPQAFWVEIDGQLLASDWAWAGIDTSRETSPRGAEVRHTIVTLNHTIRPVSIKVHTVLDGTPVLNRWLEVTNTGTQPAALSAAFSWSGVLQKMPRWQMHLPAGQPALYSVGYFANVHWGNEGDFHWFDLPNAGYQIDGRYRRDRHRHPWFVLRNNATGEHFVCQLAWSGGYDIQFDLDADLGTTDAAARLFFRAGPDAPAPQRVIAPGETVKTPEVHLGMVFGDLDSAIQAMHDHLRRSVFMPQPRGRGGWIESGIGPEIEITVDQVHHAIDAASGLGAEVFFIDASWYAPPRSDWWSTVGDWQVDRQRFPDGIKPFRDRVHERGMLWGLWMDAERIAAKSQVALAHPEWVSTAYDGDKRLGDLLDLTNPPAAQWMEEQITQVIAQNELEFFRLDYNVGGLGMGAHTLRDGFVENGYWRYYETLYAIYDRLRARFPNTILENCAGGGGRTDIGMVSRFSHTWVTDWQIAPRSFMITNGMTMALPPEHVDRLLGGQSGHTAAEFDFQWRLLMFLRPTFGFFYPLGSTVNPNMLARGKHWIELYKHFVRPFMNTGRIYHHTPVVAGPEPKGWGVLELASHDRSRAICGLFQLAAPDRPEYELRLRGLDVSKRYRATFDNTGQSCEVDGFTLMNQGIKIRLEGALTSELLLFQAV
ncbi:MAG: alpha-galactosidase [Chloroflexi bacterium]|nr:alpha-galactosidase [Chloroflexota bacterium]